MDLPERIECVATKDGAPVAGLMLLAELQTLRKNFYSIVFGPTDHQGRASLSRQTILKEAEIELNLALMDFEPLEKVFSGVVHVNVMDSKEIDGALHAYHIFKGAGGFAKEYEQNLKAALTVLGQSDGSQFQVQVNIEQQSPNIVGRESH